LEEHINCFLDRIKPFCATKKKKKGRKKRRKKEKVKTELLRIKSWIFAE